MKTNLIQNLINAYYEPFDEKYVNSLYGEITSSDNPNKLLSKHKQYLDLLRPRFHELVVKRNELAKENGHNSFFDYISNWDGIPSDELTSFFSTIPLNKKKVERILSNFSKTQNGWVKSVSNNFNLFSDLDESKKFTLPSDIYTFLKNQHLINDNQIDRIEIIDQPYGTFYTDYFILDKNVKIYADMKSKDFITASTFVHEIGHAVTYMSQMDGGIDPDNIKRFEHEKKAIEFQMRFIDAQKSQLKELFSLSNAYYYSNTLFEHEIYKDPSIDFGAEYTNARKKLYSELTEEQNDLYLLNSFLVEYPCYHTNYSVIFANTI